MKAKICTIVISDEDFNRYKKDAEDIEKLIESVKKSYMQIEKLRQSYSRISDKSLIDTPKKKRFRSVYK